METSCDTSMTHYWLVWKTLVFCYIPFLFLIPASLPVFVFIVFKICFTPSIFHFSPKRIELLDVQQEPCMNRLHFYITNCN